MLDFVGIIAVFSQGLLSMDLITGRYIACVSFCVKNNLCIQ